MWVWFTAVACLIVGRGFPPVIPAILSILTAFFIASAVYVYNDVVDVEIDKINPFKNKRPLATGKVNKNDAMKTFYISAFIGLFISVFLNIYSFLFSLIYLILFTLYSYPKIYLKNKFIIKELTQASGQMIWSLMASYAIIGSFSVNAFFASILYSILIFTAIPAFADTTDIEADMEFGLTSLAIVLSWKRKMQLLIAGTLIIMTLTPLTYVNFGFNMILPIFVVAAGLIYLRFMFPIIDHYDTTILLRARKVGYIYNISLGVFFVIASINFSVFF